MSVALSPRGAGFGTPAHRAMTSLTTTARRRERPIHLAADLGAILRSPGQTATALRHRNAGAYSENRGGWSRAEVDPAQFEAIEVWAAPEQTADVANKYTLTDRRDWLGRRRVKLEWNWSQSDRDNTERSIQLVSAHLEQAGLGSFQRWVELDGPARPPQSGLHHPMGGTRMHVDPQFGVVDDNCRVHGLDNVYVAGSSVFPTGLGYANPTLTLLALTLRLADHVKAEVGQLSSG
jgi:choline dehydrogenase-like flavoprotein